MHTGHTCGLGLSVLTRVDLGAIGSLPVPVPAGFGLVVFVVVVLVGVEAVVAVFETPEELV